MKNTAPMPATDVASRADETATTCVAALDSILRLSEMGATTREAIDQLRALAQLCNEAGQVISDIRTNLAEDEIEQDPTRLADALERLSRMSATVRAATDSADETILKFSASGR